MDLQELREAYLENLKAYNALYPVEIDGFQKGIMMEAIPEPEEKDHPFLKEFHKKAVKIQKELEDSADRSGNAQVWRRGDPLENLRPGLRQRVEKALRFGI